MNTDQYFKNIFYESSTHFNLDEMREICIDAFSTCYNWWVDDQPKWARRRTNMKLDEALKFLYSHKILFSIIYRRGYSNQHWHLEIGFCTLDKDDENGDIYLWIELEDIYLTYFIEKYNLKERL